MSAERPSDWHAKARLFLDKPEGGRSLLVAEEVEVNFAWHSLRSEEGVGLRLETCFWGWDARPKVPPMGHALPGCGETW